VRHAEPNGTRPTEEVQNYLALVARQPTCIFHQAIQDFGLRNENGGAFTFEVVQQESVCIQPAVESSQGRLRAVQTVRILSAMYQTSATDSNVAGVIPITLSGREISSTV
jgi:hypothetical protein